MLCRSMLCVASIPNTGLCLPMLECFILFLARNMTGSAVLCYFIQRCPGPVPFYVTLCHTVLCHAILCLVNLCCAVLCYSMLYYCILCYAILFYYTLCDDILCYVMLCYTINRPFCATVCYVVSCYANLSYFTLSYAQCSANQRA